jgi:adenine-specific DNA-methyltransferase
MDKLKMKTPDRTQENIERIAKLFPNVITEVEDETTKDTKKYKKVVDFDLLRQMLSGNLVEGDDERYRLDWPGKKASLLKANIPITLTLRPCREESVNFDTTENLYIEGDNFVVLKILQESYLGKIKVIIIDPPYNTGNDFIYKDDFKKSKDEYEEEIGVEDEEGGKLFRNTDSNGRFHSDWLSMMYERLIVARDLLRDDGVIFIHIDDNEVHNLRKICDEIFGEENFLAELIWHLSSGPQAGHFTRSNEIVIVYAKFKELLPFFEDNTGGIIKHGALKRISLANPASEIEFKKGSIAFEGQDAIFGKELGGSEKQFVTKGTLRFEKGLLAEDVTIKAGWAMKNQVISWLEGNETWDSKGQKVVRFYFNQQGILFYEKERGTLHPKTVISAAEVGSTKVGGDEILNLFGLKLMSFPKPTGLIKFLIKTASNNNDIILDFFSGSATTAHAVMQLNSEDGGNRKFIMVQLPEPCDEKSEAYKAGYKTIADIGKERIRRAGKKILEELATKNTKGTKKEKGEENLDLFRDAGKKEDLSSVSCLSWQKSLDVGFRVYKTADTNMKEVFYHPYDIKQDNLLDYRNNIKEDRTPEDLLTQVILDLGLELSLPIEQKTMHGNNVFIVQTRALVACFDNDIDFKIIDEIATLKPLKVVFKDASFKDDKDRINVEERFKRLSPDTRVTVI